MIGHPNLLAWYRMQSSASDSSGNGRNATATNITSATGVIGGGYNFFVGGSASYLTLPNTFSSIMGNNDFTICMFCKPINITDYMMLFELRTDTNALIEVVLYQGKLYCVLYDGSVYATKQCATVCSTSSIQHLAFMRKSNQIYGYFNGILDGHINDNKNVGGNISGVRLGLATSNSYPFKGYMDEAMVFNKAFEASDVNRLSKGKHPLNRS